MRGIPVLEKYQYILYFKWYDIIMLHNLVFHTLQLRSAPVGGFPNCCATGKCDNRTRWIKLMKLSAHPKLINKENSRSVIWHYFGYKTDDKGERTDLTAPVCKRCYRPTSCCHRNTTNLFKHLSLAHPDLFRELTDRQVSASFKN